MKFPPRQFLRSPRARYIAGALVVLVLAGYWYMGRGDQSGAMLTITPGDFKEQVSVSGTVTAAENVDLGFSSSGRIAYIGAIAHEPKVLFADEPTANLDRESSDRVIGIFKELHEAGQTIIMVTHEEEYARAADRLVKLDDGEIVAAEALAH